MKNLINETNTFFRIAASLELTTQSRMLYLSLLQKNNSLYWSEFFTVTASELQGLSGLSQSGMQRARKQLVDKGIVIYKNRGSNRAPKYCLPELTNEFVITILNGTPNNTTVNTAVNRPNSTTVNSPNTLIDNTIQYNTKQIDASSSSVDHTTAVSYWLNQVNPAEAPTILESIAMWVEDFNGNDALVILAIDEMLKNRARSYNYLNKVLKSWEDKKLDSVEKVQKHLEGGYQKSNFRGKRRVEPKELSKPPERKMLSDDEANRILRERQAANGAGANDYDS
ncbi:DnaD domain-containing protein [Enterococcus sp. LJL90]